MESQREDARSIFAAGLAAAEPGRSMHRILTLDGKQLHCGSHHIALESISTLRIVGAGKATAAMAAAAEEILGDRIEAGAINT